MKEKIYTIPVNDAYDTDCECPLCLLESRLEEQEVEYCLGAAMMEPDFRVDSNKTGYCRRHFSMMLDKPKKLPLALVLDTHLDDVRQTIDKLCDKAEKLSSAKRGLFNKNGTDKTAAELTSFLTTLGDSCVICKKTAHTMDRYADVLLYMWAEDDAFREKFDRSKGVCLKHFKLLVDTLPKSLKGEKADSFLAALLKKEKQELKRIQEDIHKFTLKFDYRNQAMDWGTAKDAPLRTIEKLDGYIYSPDTESETPKL